MAPSSSTTPFLCLLFFSILLLSSTTILSSSTNQTTYIIFMNPSHKPTPINSLSLWFSTQLQSLSIDPSRHLLYSYSSLLPSAFAASLLPHHLPLLHSHPSVLFLLPDPLLHPLTTRTPLFLHLPSPLYPSPTSASSDVIVGVLDTGVWPESPSFSDAGLPPIPSRWRGQCESSVDFSPSLCNRKLIGARSFSSGFHATAAGDPKEHFSARDRDGHGTHTASTAAGSFAPNASFFGYAQGTARGMAPLARIAAYKVCWSSGCYGSDILAAMEQAIADGVDILSLSLGGSSASLSHDPVAIGALAAVARGVFVSCSAGNSGPYHASLTNTAPWIATVGAGTLDRDFPAYATLGNGQRFTGVSLYGGEGMGSKQAPLVYGKGSQSNANTSRLCLSGSLNPADVKGKVVFCDRGINARVQKGKLVKDAGGVGMILANAADNGEELIADSHLLPAVAVGVEEGDKIRKYVTSESNPTAVLTFGGTVVDIRPSPVVAAFSSRGPDTVVPEILKPDLIGPGVNILAGWSGSIGPTGLENDVRRPEFNILSGTSMSCPHISGVAALLKAAHPSWSPSAIKSALMTTAYVMDNIGSRLRDDSDGSMATPMAYGSGYVNPQKALSPGLIYDATHDDYIAFLCSIEPNVLLIQSITKKSNNTCSRKLANPGNLNYPSFSVVFSRKSRKAVKYTRVVTNVGSSGSTYTVEVDGPATVGVVVKPARLVFRQAGQKLRYSVIFTSEKEGGAAEMAFGSITWSDGQHLVKSPVSYSWSFT